MKITDKAIKQICSDSVFKAGSDYYKEGRVHIRTRSDDCIVATVDSDRIYNVHICFDKDDNISETFCTCPYFQTMSSNCKHIVATLKMRMAELSEGEDFADNNDKVAERLCAEFEEKNEEKKKLPVSFAVNITTGQNGKNGYFVGIRLGELKTPANNTEEFLYAYLTGCEYKLSKHKVYKNSKFCFEPWDKYVLDILAEALENKLSTDSLYTKKITACEIGANTARRIFPLLKGVDCSFAINGMNCQNALIRNEDPDILADVTARDNGINISVTQCGLAIVPGGEWFYYDGDIYETTEKWRDWYMPIYNALYYENRTQIDFKGNNSISFAANILPRLKGKKGVILQGIEETVIDDTPQFDVYLDRLYNGISAAITVRYGKIKLQLPSKTVGNEKIIVRNYDAENKLLSCFDEFTEENKRLYLEGNDQVFCFITDGVEQISRLARIHTSESFERLMSRLPKITQNVSYNKEIDLLEVGFESEITPSEIAGILSALRNKKPYYRMADGTFYITNTDNREYELLNNLNFSFGDLKEKKKLISKSYALFLAGMNSDSLTKNKEFEELIEEIRSIRADIPDYLVKILRDYQKTGVHWLKQLSDLGFGGILADDMGLGKTLEVISFVMSEKADKPALIVTPSSLTYNWLNEIRKFAPEAKAKIIDGTKEDRIKEISDIEDYQFIITSYNMLRRDISEYSEKKFFCTVIDEAQHIKNPKTLSAKAVKAVRTGSCFALSGTPIENSLSELWSIFDFVMPGYLGTHSQFSDNFEKHIVRDGDDETAERLRHRIKPFVLRRMKTDVLSELPEKIENTFYAEPSPMQKKLYLSFLSAAKREAKEIKTYGGDNMRILALLMRLRQICCHPKLIDETFDKESGKLMLFEDILSSGISAGHRVLVFSQFTSMLAIIKERLDELGISYFYFDGSTPPEKRTELAERFNKGEKSVFLISLKAGGTGINLTGADMVIHYDPWWNPAAVDQASDRAYRIGQTKAVHIIKLATRGTVEEHMIKLQDKKKNLAEDMIRTNSKTFSTLSKEELLSFFAL